MTSLVAVQRVFKIGATTIDCPAPQLPLKDAIRMLCKSYPMFRQTKIFEEDGVMENGKMTFTLQMPPSKVNG
jgi:hypothetical protein